MAAGGPHPSLLNQLSSYLTGKQRMARKLRTKTGEADYARRKVIVEPVFGQIATLQGKHVRLRGLDSTRGEWNLLAACHNLRKLHGHLGRRTGNPSTGRLRLTRAVLKARSGPWTGPPIPTAASDDGRPADARRSHDDTPRRLLSLMVLSDPPA